MEDIGLIHEDLSYILRGIFYEVHNELGRFRNEKQYCDLIEEKIKIKLLSYRREVVLDPSFEGEKKGRNRTDFILENKIIIEVKATPSFSRNDYMQCQRYLVSSGLKLCLLVNFGLNGCVIKRILNPNLPH
ncbi:GxxExxY protein [Patescibacteria group bacterium]|nr:GxxExxY protein [Patescibacteria group bacterium]